MNTELQAQVVYIVGSSRSGSTILNILLGNIDGLFAAGELNHYMSMGKDSNEYCSCGKPVTTCNFWPVVRNSAERTISDPDINYRDLTKTFENWRSLLPIGRTSRRALKKQYVDYSDAYITSILKTSKMKIIVDASKSPVRLLNLLSSTRHDYKIIHTIRDPRAICVSLNTPLKKDIDKGVQKDLPGRQFRRTIKDLYIITILSAITRFRVPKGNYLRIHHEDLVSKTDVTINQLQTFLGINCQQLVQHLADGGELQQSHNVAGNRLRMQKSIKIAQPSKAWHTGLSTTKALLLTIALAPLQKIFS